jgi:hypothetical protein
MQSILTSTNFTRRFYNINIVYKQYIRYIVYLQGGVVNHGLKRFFSLYRPSCLIEAYVRPEKYWLAWAGPLANYPFNFNFIFLSDSLMVAVCFADIYSR